MSRTHKDTKKYREHLFQKYGFYPRVSKAGLRKPFKRLTWKRARRLKDITDWQTIKKLSATGLYNPWNW